MLFQYIFSKATNDLALLKAYMEAWKRFMFYYNYVPLPFQPLEKYFYKATTLAGSTAAGKKRHEIESYIRLVSKADTPLLAHFDLPKLSLDND